MSDPTTWGDYQGVHPEAAMFKRWVVVRKWPVGVSGERIRGFWPTWTQRGAERVARRWRRQAVGHAQWDAERGVPAITPRVLVLDMRKHPARTSAPVDEEFEDRRFWENQEFH